MIKRYYLVLLGFFYCAFCTSVSIAQSAPLRLGMISPLSGDFAVYGQHIKDGIVLAQEQLKTEGVDTQIFYEDACLPMQARGSINKLITVDKIQGLVGSYCIIGMVPSALILENAHLIAFHTSVVPQILLDSGDYVFTTNIRIRDEAEKLAQYAFNKLGARRAATIYATTQWGEEYTRYFSKEFKRLGGTVVLEQSIPLVANDIRSELTMIRGKDADVVLAVHVGSILGSLLKKARQLGLTQQFLTVNEAEELSVIKASGDASEGLIFLSPEPSIETSAMKDFVSKFKLKFGRDAHPLAKHSYDAMMLTANALKKCGGDHNCAKDELYKIKDYSGASGPFTIQSDGGTEREFIVKMVKGGQFVRQDQ